MIFFFSERICTANSFDIRNIVQTKYHNLDAFLEPTYLSVHHLRCAFVILCEVQTQFKLLNKNDFHLEVRYDSLYDMLLTQHYGINSRLPSILYIFVASHRSNVTVVAFRLVALRGEISAFRLHVLQKSTLLSFDLL